MGVIKVAMDIKVTTDIVQVVMPVGSDPDFREKQAAMKRGIEAAGFIPRFPDYQLSNPTFEPQRFEEQLKSATVVLADLTDERPSCYFEIGFAEALERPIFLIAEQGTTIHQSAFRHAIQHYGTLADLQQVVFRLLSEGAEWRAGRTRHARSAT